jgi:NADH:ubiquinone oxidoreductase subunit E
MSKKFELQICMGSSCFSRGNKDLAVFIKDYLKKNHLDDRVVFRGARCLGHCTYGPAIIINDRIIDGVGIADIEALLDTEFGNLR